MVTSTGSPVLDDLLDGGFPEGRVVLLTGGPGSGKTTFGLQYLQAGLDAGESCLFVSTEQTPEELRTTYRSFDFELDHDELTLVTLRQQPGEADADRLTFTTLGDEREQAFAGARVPFTVDHLLMYLERFADRDRIVLDSVSGLAALAEDPAAYRQAILELVWSLSEGFAATTVLTAEGTGDEDPGHLQYTAHGVVRLFEGPVAESLHRFLRIEKMRGVDHDRRQHEFTIRSDGLRVSPPRTVVSPVHHREPLSTGIAGLDDLCGGGLFYKQPVVLQHDGRVDVDPFTTAMLCQAVEQDGGAVLFAPAHLDEARLDDWIAPRVGSSRDLLDDDRLFVLDWFDAWGLDHRNVFPIHRGWLRELVVGSRPVRDPLFRRLYERIDAQRGDRDVISIVYTETLLHDLSPEIIRFQARWVQPNIFHDDDVLVVAHNPAVMERRLAEFFVYDAVQVFDLWRERGHQNYVSVVKSPEGVIGESRLVEPLEEPPFVRVD